MLHSGCHTTIVYQFTSHYHSILFLTSHLLLKIIIFNLYSSRQRVHSPKVMLSIIFNVIMLAPSHSLSYFILIMILLLTSLPLDCSKTNFFNCFPPWIVFAIFICIWHWRNFIIIHLLTLAFLTAFRAVPVLSVVML